MIKVLYSLIDGFDKQNVPSYIFQCRQDGIVTGEQFYWKNRFKTKERIQGFIEKRILEVQLLATAYDKHRRKNPHLPERKFDFDCHIKYSN